MTYVMLRPLLGAIRCDYNDWRTAQRLIGSPIDSVRIRDRVGPGMLAYPATELTQWLAKHWRAADQAVLDAVLALGRSVDTLQAELLAARMATAD